MSRRKQLTPEQIARVNRTLRHLASELERRRAKEAQERAAECVEEPAEA